MSVGVRESAGLNSQLRGHLSGGLDLETAVSWVVECFSTAGGCLQTYVSGMKQIPPQEQPSREVWTGWIHRCKQKEDNDLGGEKE